MKRFLIALLVGGVLFTAAFAAAASLTVEGGTMQTGSDLVLECDPDGVYVDGWGFPWSNPPVMVNYVRIKGIHGDCETCDLMVLVTQDGNTIAYGAARPIGGTGEVTVYFGPPEPGPTSVPAANITDVHVSIEGPCPAF